MIAYAAVRRAVRTDVETTTTATHWEWYDACTEADVEHLDAIHRLTETFEHVAFAPAENDSTQSAEATQAVELAREILTTESVRAMSEKSRAS